MNSYFENANKCFNNVIKTCLVVAPLAHEVDAEAGHDGGPVLHTHRGEVQAGENKQNIRARFF